MDNCCTLTQHRDNQRQHSSAAVRKAPLQMLPLPSSLCNGPQKYYYPPNYLLDLQSVIEVGKQII